MTQKGGCFSWLFGKTRKSMKSSSKSSNTKRQTSRNNRINKNHQMGEDILDKLENDLEKSFRSSRLTKQALNDNKFTMDSLSRQLTRRNSNAASAIQRMSRGHSARKTVKNMKKLKAEKARIPELEKQIKELEEAKAQMPKKITRQKTNATRRIGELKSILSTIKEK